MPHDLRHGQWLEPTLALIASNHREYTAQIQLWTAWRSTKKGPQERPIFIEHHLDSRSALRLVLAISTVRPTLRNREVWTRTGTGESRSEASHRQVCGRQRSPCHGGMLTEMGWGKGKCPLPQRPIPENNTWSFAQNSGHT